jgi:acyl carrier protein
MPDAPGTYVQIVQLIADVFMVDPTGLTPQSTANDVPGWDSVSQVALVMKIEDTFGIELDPGEVGAAKDVQALADLVDLRKASASTR